MGTGRPRGDAARVRRQHVRPEQRRLRAGVRRQDRRAALGVQAPVSRRRERRHEPRDRDLGHDADRRERGQHDVRDRRAHRQARLGNEGARADVARAAVGGPDRRERQGHHGPSVPARARPAIRASSRRTTRRPARSSGARARFPRKGEPGDETWGDVPMEQRWHVGTWMVPSYDPELDKIYIGTSVTIPAREVHSRRRRQAAPLSRLDARARSRDRQDRLVLPASDRSLGPRSSVRAVARRYGGRARSERGHLDQSASEARRDAQGDHGHPGQDRHRLHARPRRRASSCGRGRPCIRTS